MKRCGYCGREREDDILACPQCGKGGGGEPFDSESKRAVVELFAISSDNDCRLWPQDVVKKAQTKLTRAFKRPPTIETIYANFGQQVTDGIVAQFVSDRVSQIQEATSHNQAVARIGSIAAPVDVCQTCGSGGEMKHFYFGLAKIESAERDWSRSLASILLSLVVLPLFGRVMVSGPTKKTRARIVPLTLQVCSACLHRRHRLFGRIRLSRADYAKQPKWAATVGSGYSEFMTPKQMAEYQ